jgi:hypothetical protein
MSRLYLSCNRNLRQAARRPRHPREDALKSERSLDDPQNTLC